jgi:hypothetical protein
MAEVFLARAEGAEGFTRRVALKRVLPGFSEHAELARMFVSEAQLSSRLQHPNIVSVLDFDRDDRGQLFLVMELVDGVDLGNLLDTGALGVPLIIYLAIEILSGLPLRPRSPAPLRGRGPRHRPSRRLAAQRAAVLGGRGEGLGLRHREGPRGQPRDGDRDRPGQAGVHEPRAGERAGAGRAQRPVRPPGAGDDGLR